MDRGDVQSEQLTRQDRLEAPSRARGTRTSPRSLSPAGRRDLIELQEHRTNVLRLRKVLVLAIVLWFVCGVPLDLIASTVSPSVDFHLLVQVRMVVLLIIVPPALLLLKREPPSLARFRFIDTTVFVTTAIGGTVMCVLNGGVYSPYTGSLVCILIVRGISLPDPWWRGAVFLGLPALAYPLTFGVAALLSPVVASQLTHAAPLAAFVQNTTVVLVAWLLLTAGGHVHWAVRRQLFESRDLGRYRLREAVGSGAMGDVWRAWHPGLRRDVAVKVLRFDRTDLDDAVVRFEREVMAMSQLRHPNTVRVFDCGVTEDGLWYYVMELLEGETLAERIHRDGPLPAAQVARIGHQAAGALAEAHALGVVHRDVKPDNLFLAKIAGSELVKVLDFGLAQLVAEDATVTRTGWIVGTPAYIAPEQAAGVAVDARTDIYSLGAALYFAATGHALFDRSSGSGFLRSHMFDEPAPPSQVWPVPPELEGIIMRCLRKSPDDRYQTASELAAALAAIDVAGALPTTVTPPEEVTGAGQPAAPDAVTQQVRQPR